MNYEQIKQLARVSEQRVGDLIVLAPQNDPFYTGTPNDWAMAEWFAAVWRTFGYQSGVHLRRIHYQVVSQDPPLALPNGKGYENTMECWDFLNLASKAARYLQLVDPAAFVDRKNAEAVIYAPHEQSDPYVYLGGYTSKYNFSLPDFPDVPGYRLSGYSGQQRYHLEVWCEKSTMNDILLPLCQQYGANLQIGSGELSITSALSLVQRLQQASKPARIFYVSDFDPAGQSMPVAISRKVEYFIRTLDLDLDVRVFPVVLTSEQVRAYGLPRTPIKETERRRIGFEERYGEGAVELDALESLYPGQLAAILGRGIECYYDTSLEERVEEARLALQAVLDTAQDGVLGAYELLLLLVSLGLPNLMAVLAGQAYQTSYAVVGSPTISAAFIDTVLSAYHSPAVGLGSVITEQGVRYGIDPVYALAFFWHESAFGTTGEARVTRSPGNERCIADRPCIDQEQGGYALMTSWVDGFDHWFRLIRDVYVNTWGRVTVAQIIPKYAPSSDGNDETASIQAVEHAVDVWRSGKLWV